MVRWCHFIFYGGVYIIYYEYDNIQQHEAMQGFCTVPVFWMRNINIIVLEIRATVRVFTV